MKKLLAMLLAGLMLVSVMSVAAFGLELPDISEYAPDEGVTFYALVFDASVSAKGYGYIAACGLTINDINHRDLFTASFSANTEILNDSGEITATDLSRGDIIAMTYCGEVLESYPSDYLGTTRVYVVDHVDTLAEIESLLPDGYEEYGDYIPAWNDFAGLPQNLDCTVSNGKVKLSWANISDEGYTVYWKRSSSNEWKVAGTTAKHKVNIVGLKSSVSYDFKVEICGEDSEVATITAP